MKKYVLLFALPLILGVSACGIRGDLERPEPLVKPAETKPVQTSVVAQPRQRVVTRTTQGSYRDPVTGQTVWVQNSEGGEKPMASPSQDVSEGGLQPVGSSN